MKGSDIHAKREKERKDKLRQEKGSSVFAEKKRTYIASQSEVKTDHAFKKAVMTGPDYICICCHRKLFKKSVSKVTQKFEEDMKQKHQGILHKCLLGIRSPEEEVKQQNTNNTTTFKAAKVADISKYKTDLEKSVLPQIEERFKLDDEVWMCNTCKGHLRRGNMPPQCHQNGLVIKETLQDNPDTALTSVENVLISRMIPFAKIYPLKKSRWSALDGKIINIPITKDKLEETVKSFPRTPKEGAMIFVAVKRKKEYDNTYKKPNLARPHLLIK